MKYPIPALIVLLLAFTSFSGCSTPPPANEADYSNIEYVVQLEGMKSTEIFDGTKLWIAENFRSAKHVIDIEDRSSGIIVGNGILQNVILESGLVKMPLEAEFKMKVEVKDGKMRLTFSNFKMVGRVNSTLYKTEADQIKQRLLEFGDEIARFLKSPKRSDF